VNRADGDGTRFCIVAAVPLSLGAFMAPHIRALSGDGHVTMVACSADTTVRDLCGPRVTFAPVAIAREIAIVADVRALVALWRLFRRGRFTLVQSITPKAGLLSMVAARLAGVPLRVHWFTGQVWATQHGARRWLLKSLDRLLAACASHLLADSASQRAFLAREGVAAYDRITVLGRGSVCGVDSSRFRPDAWAYAAIRGQLGIPADHVVALYVGRLHREKGVPELAAAFAAAAGANDRLHLLLVGPDEQGLRPALAGVLANYDDRVHFVDQTDAPEKYMAASDFFVIPSHREGFGSTVIEAAACGLPSIGTLIYGLSDAIVDGETGLLVPVGDAEMLSCAIVRLATDERLRAEMGRAARTRVLQHFAQAELTTALRRYYDSLVSANLRA
jgi:glycosyltransferase involved in cell wall biosynthesis